MRGLIDADYLRGESIRDLRDDILSRSRGGARATRELDNKVNMHWYLGQPWFRRMPESNRIVGLSPDQRSKYIHVNKTREVVRTIKGVMFYEPSVEASPRTIDAEDIARAQMASDVGNHIKVTGRLSRAYSQTLEMANIKGHGWIKVVYDPLAGSRRPTVTNETCPTCSGSGTLVGQDGPRACWNCAAQGLVPLPGGGMAGAGYIEKYAGVTPEGDVRFIALDPDDVFPDPEAPTLDDGEVLVIRMRMSRSEAWQKYGRDNGFREEDFVGEASLDGDMSHLAATSNHALPSDQRYVNVWEVYQRPTEKHSDGIFGVCVGELEVVGGRLPYVHDSQHFPVFPFPMYETLGLLYPVSTVDLVLPLILAYNDHLSTLHARARLSAKLRFKVPRSARFEVDDKNGNVFYSPTPRGDKPEELNLGSAPQDNANIIQVLGEAIDSLSGSTDVVRGAFQTADSARAMAFLEERALGPLKPIIADHTERLERVLRFGIDLARLHYDDGRLIRLEGSSGAFESREFRVENVGEATDVKIAVVRNVGRSRATMMSELNEAADRKMVDPETYMRLSEFGDQGQIYKEKKLHIDHASMENQMLLRQGVIPAPTKGQRHDLHLTTHAQKLIELQMSDPNHPAIQALLQHIEFTEQMQAQQNAQQAMLAQGVVDAAQPAAAAYGAMNAADGAAQPPPTADAAQAAGATEPFSNQMAGPPESQPSLNAAEAAAGAVET